MDYHYTVQYKEEDGVIIATLPALKGCVSYGDTLEEAEKNIQEAMELYIEDLIENGEEIPLEKSPAHLQILKTMSISLPTI